jgi:hypothetical protein
LNSEFNKLTKVINSMLDTCLIYIHSTRVFKPGPLPVPS